MIRLAVFDIDGTLIPHETHCIAPETAAAINQLKRWGVRIAIASGRQWQTLHQEIRALEFDYYILSNGSYIMDTEGNVVLQQQIDAQTVESLTKDFLDRNYPLTLRYVTGNVSVNPNRDVLEYSAQFFSPEQLKHAQEELDKHANEDRTGQLPVACMGHIEVADKAYFDEKYPQLQFMLTGRNLLCDINKAGVSKATGMAEICAYLGIAMCDTIAFGDDGNDVEFVRDAGIGVAMGNAVPAVLGAADYITDRCENLGVVKALKHFKLLD